MTHLMELQGAAELIAAKIQAQEPLLIINKGEALNGYMFNQYLYHYLKTLPNLEVFNCTMDIGQAVNPLATWSTVFKLAVPASSEQELVTHLQQIIESGKRPVLILNQAMLMNNFENLQKLKRLMHDHDASYQLVTTIQITDYDAPFSMKALQNSDQTIIVGAEEDPAAQVIISAGLMQPWAIKAMLSGRSLKKLLTGSSLKGDIFKKVDQIIWYVTSLSVYVESPALTDQLAQLHEQLNLGEIDETIHGLQVVAKNL